MYWNNKNINTTGEEVNTSYQCEHTNAYPINQAVLYCPDCGGDIWDL